MDRVELAFRKFDTNNDGYLTRDEFDVMMKNVSKEQADRIFKSCDTSGDDRISLDEFRTMLNKAPNMGGGGKDGKAGAQSSGTKSSKKGGPISNTSSDDVLASPKISSQASTGAISKNIQKTHNGTNIKSNTNTIPGIEIADNSTKVNCLTSRQGNKAEASNNRCIAEKKENSLLTRKSKRIEERRYLTIGYTGEKVRSPLKEKQNLIATVQRSKSAQTPTKPNKVQSRFDSGNKNRNRRKQFKDSPYTENILYSENMTNIRRSMSLRSPNPVLEIPSSLKETIYDVTTPKSDKVKRNLSDRVITPGKGGKKETTPYIKTALFSDGKKRTPIKKPVGISQHSRLQQIIHQEGTSLSSKRSNILMKQYPRVYNYSGASPALRKSPRIVNLH